MSCRSLRPGVVVRSLLALAMVGLLGFVAACGSAPSSDLPTYGDAPSFSLTDQLGRSVTSEDVDGKVILANLVFTSCTDSCPVVSPRMAELQQALARDGLLPRDVTLISFGVDPEHDTPQTLKAYAERYGADHASWRFLSGAPDAMRQVVTEGFKLAFGEVPGSVEHMHADGSTHVHDYDVTHSARVVLSDTQGRVRAYYDGVADWDVETVLSDVKALLK